MAFYTYKQNNSGGFFSGPEVVIVEADSAAEADNIAQDNGVYFHGVSLGLDCSCCGNRWTSQVDWDEEGEAEPLIYGEKPEEYRNYRGENPEILIVRKS